jgi:hypothetical protein
MLHKLAQESGKSFAEVEKLWEDSKALAAKKFKEGSPQFYPYLVGIVKRRLGLGKEESTVRVVKLQAMPAGDDSDNDDDVGWNTLTAPTSTQVSPREVNLLTSKVTKIKPSSRPSKTRIRVF